MVQFICGRSGQGKTQYIFDDIKRQLQAQHNKPIYLIVPDQMSFQTEFELLQQLEHEAMMHVEVLGISRFVTQMIEYLSQKKYIVFDTLSQKMLLQQAALELQASLAIYGKAVDKPEFIDYLHQFSRQLKGTGISLHEGIPVDIATQQPILKQKLKEVDQIFQLYQSKLTSDMFDLADKLQYYLTLLSQPQHQSKMQDLLIYVDGYYTFNKLETEVIAQTLKQAQQGMISFCIDEKGYQSNSIFYLIQEQMRQFTEKIPHHERIFLTPANNRFNMAPALNIMEQNYEQPKSLQHTTMTDAIDVTIYQTIEQEVAETIRRIRRLMLVDGIRAKEVAIYLPKKELYAPLIEQYCAMYEVPFYLDLKETMLIHPVFSWFYALLQIKKNNWQIEDILSLLHNDFFRKQQQIVDADYYLFVDFIEQIRFPYKRIWRQKRYWRYYDTPEKLADSYNEDKTNRIETIRVKLVQTITEFEDIFKQKQTKDVLTTLFNYIQKQEVYQYINTQTSHKEHAKYLAHVTEKQYQENVWKQLIIIFEQTFLALGEQKYRETSLVQALLLGLENAEFTSVPNGYDAVMIGDFARTRFQTLHQENSELSMGVQYAFILGVTDKFVPYAEETVNILSNEELLVIRTNNLLQDVLLQDEAINYQLFRFYTLVTSAAKQVHLSYYQYGGIYLDEEHEASSILKNKFINTGFDVTVNHYQEKVNTNLGKYTKQAAKDVLAWHFHRSYQTNATLFQVVKAIDPAYISHLEKAQQYKNIPQVSELVITPANVSLTQIETYNNCPYQYFLKYILHIPEPTTDRLRAVQTGTLLHDAYELLVQQSVTAQVKLNELIKPELAITAFFQEKEATLASHPIFHFATNRFLYEQTRHVALQSLSYILANEAASTFVPKYLEYQLPKKEIIIQGQAKYLIGKLDRIDFDATGNFFRIIDYKSSKKSIEFNKLLYGTQLQLPLYSLLATSAFKQQLAGSMYIPLLETDALIDFSTLGTTDVDKILQKNYQATGFFLDDQTSLTQFDQTLLTQNKSLVIPYETKKDGTANQHSAVLTAKEINIMQDFSLQQAKKTLTKIETRDFSVHPIREEFDYATSPCRFCPFKRVCQFDQKINCYNDKTKIIKEQSFVKKKEKFLTEISVEGSESDGN